MYSKNNSRRFKMIRTNKGFTLIELMVVIVIIGVLAALAIPKFTDAATKAKFAEVPTVMASYDHAQLAYVSETGALGLSTALVFDAPAGSKWFSYADNAAGTYEGTTSAAVGAIPTATLVARTNVTTGSIVTHTVVAVAAAKYLVNF
jgi:prepilin-type N-terminal cleavage/methylation domain-containing protein